ncbi:unnamed protein product [Owenia fusiformis]|uniref:Solute carrier organic anion transporter family member n=1 Tax=Owenia fusiformis TaxID=6347 RepID=A0A8J1URP2_OWEFU|nr:unnamed protein product [Owenia fusiformis]
MKDQNNEDYGSKPLALPFIAIERNEDLNPETDFKFGWGHLTPLCLQRFNKTPYFLACLGVGNLALSMAVNGQLGVSLPSIEMKFQLSSTLSGVIYSAYDMANAPVSLLVTIFLSKAHRPRWLALAALITALGSFIFTLPHFLSPLYDYSDGESVDNTLLCSGTTTNHSNTTNMCDYGQSSSRGNGLSIYFWLFVLGNVLHGLGSTCIHALGVTFLDDTTPTSSFSLYFSIYACLGVIGPCLGFIGGGMLLGIYTDFDRVQTDSVTINQSDSRWVGAWWLGFLLTAFLSLLVALPLSAFPRDLPGAAAIRASRQSESHGASSHTKSDVGFGVPLKQVPKTFIELMRNPPYVSSIFVDVFNSVLVAGFSAFGPKLMKNQFHLSSSMAGMVFGLIAVPGAAGGDIFGGILIKKLKLSCRGLLKLVFILNFITVFCTLPCIIYCDTIPLVGVNTGYNGSTLVSMKNTCNDACSCHSTYNPICGDDGNVYFSPCHAGCKSSDVESLNYSNCSCVDSMSQRASVEEACVTWCPAMFAFIIFLFFNMFFLFATHVAGTQANMRYVKETHRLFSMGIRATLIRVLGTIPGTVLFGAVLDHTCTLWQSQCGSDTSCLVYDNAQMGLNVMLLALTLKILSTLSSLVAWRSYRPPQPTILSQYSLRRSRSREYTKERFIEENGERLSPLLQAKLNGRFGESDVIK